MSGVSDKAFYSRRNQKFNRGEAYGIRKMARFSLLLFSTTRGYAIRAKQTGLD